MSKVRILLPNTYLNGARATTSTLRPVRLAYLVPDDDTEIVTKVVQSYCLTWSGTGSFIIPFSRSAGLATEWERVLRLLDPDKLVTLGKLPEDDHERLKDEGWMVYTSGNDAFPVATGVLLQSALAAMGQHLESPSGQKFLVLPKLPNMGAARLPLLARFGIFDETALQASLNRRWSYQYQFDLDLSKVVEVREVDLQGAPPAVFAGDLRDVLGESDAERALSLPDLLSVGLQRTESARPWATSKAPFLEDADAAIVITGEDDNIQDLALYWNLRSERDLSSPFPLWVPLSLLRQAEIHKAIYLTLKDFQARIARTSPRQPALRIVSASTSPELLETNLRSLYPEAEIGVENLADLIAVRCEYKHTAERQIAQFEDGRASIRPPVPEELKDIGPDVNQVAYEVSVDEVWVPQAKDIAWATGLMHHRERITAGGNFRFVKTFSRSFSEPKLLDVRVPDGWTILTSIFGEGGYEATPTAKSKTTLGQLALFGGIDGVNVAASSKVHDFLKVLSGGRGKDRSYILDRQTTTLNQANQAWGKKVGPNILRWLIEKRVLIRGTRLTCPACQLRRWYEIDRFGEVWRCDGCKEDLPIPLGLDQTGWRYRINELYAHGLDQGTVTPLLSLHALNIFWRGSTNKEGLGFYPGIELEAKEGADVPVDRKLEIDLVVLRGENLVFVECKEDGNVLDDPKEASEFALQLGELVEVAEHFGVEQVLVTTPTSFPADKSSLIERVSKDCQVSIVWLDGETILDPDIDHPLSYLGGDPSEYSKPEGWADEYLEWVGQTVASPSFR